MKFPLRIAGLLVGLAMASTALAHAMLDRAVPRVGSSVHVAPARVELWFSEPLEPALSTLRVVDASGHPVDRRDAAVDPRDGTHLSVSLLSLPPGRYRVVWRAVSVDTHATAGDFTFDVSP